MANEIKLTPEQMRQRAKEYAREKDNFDKSIQKMNTLINNLQSEWTGAASQAYAKRYESLKPAFNNASELMQELSTNLNTSAKIMEEADRNIANQLK